MTTSRLSNPRREAFCRYLVFGNPDHDPDDPELAPQTVGNGRQSYIRAGYRARGASADASASRLLRSPEIQRRIVELSIEEEQRQSVRLRRWRALLPKAQRVLEDAMNGKDIGTRQLQAAKEVIGRAEGPARYRFSTQKAEEAGSPFKVTLWSGRRTGRDGSERRERISEAAKVG